MSKRVKVLATVMSALVISSAFIGCGKKDDSTAAKDSKGGKELVVWSHLMTNEVKELDKIAQQWAKETGNKVKVVEDKGDFQAYIQASQSSKGPDIMYGLANDNLGTFQKAGVLAEVPSGVIDKSKFASQSVIDAVTLQGKQYAVPIAMETYALFYNTDKVKEVPKSMDELVTKAKEVGFKYDVNNFYYSYAFLAANGGYVFKNNNGSLDAKDIGLNNDGAVKGYQFIQDLVVKNKFMSADIKGDGAKGDFQAGKIGFYISGPWDVKGFQDAKVPFKVVPLPQTNGKATPSFMGVQTAFVSSKSKNQDTAWELMKYLNDKTPLVLFETGNRIPVLNDALNSDKFKASETAVQFAEQAKVAQPMPNIPEIQAMWTPGANNLQLLTAGKVDAKKAADTTVEQIKQGIAQQK
ncbi:maltose ABC transporter substrate-binding protein [Clostridium folliculivorans]|uniref:Maltodextrin-binding protein n=1 Tax=Clostridium folliculivorans TaxID=2886038 RepID=A0A9W6DAU0_9CLOT|nr:maltose ABC transporter substrate-binding protein [Clostridium folliculivorans]GKU25725.1 maltose ABC transporter substrate-binding protein [Clostridium folliculivorans]GKU28747.1 maltose ABC transporter substrate-binding protein [Clostridium folliculivorans]